LSYTTFAIGNANLSKTVIKTDESIELTIPVVNKGKRDGTEIVQVYVHKANDTDGPLKTLRGFQRVHVAAGKTGQAIITLPYTSFEFFDRASRKMAVTPGEYEVLYGNSSNAKDLKTTRITIQ
jgi:beta-glucosidase